MKERVPTGTLLDCVDDDIMEALKRHAPHERRSSHGMSDSGFELLLQTKDLSGTKCSSGRNIIGLVVCVSLSLSFILLRTFPLLLPSLSYGTIREILLSTKRFEKFDDGNAALMWAEYTPYFDAGVYTPVPDDCEISQVNIIQRHGARFPTSGAGPRSKAAIEKLQAANQTDDPRLAFLRNYTYDLGTTDLVPLGAIQSFESGGRMFERYKSIVGGDDDAHVPFVRAASAERCVDSARNWTAGFSSSSNGSVNPILNLVISEDGNCTLDDSMCPSAPDLTTTNVEPWEIQYATPISARLEAIAPGANLTASDITSLIALCAYDSVNGDYEEGDKVRVSDVCGLFEDRDFEGFQYEEDLSKYYGTGYGNPLGRIQGVGYVNELLARLTNTAVNDSTQTNRTLDASSETFPLNRTLYADFSHDNLMVAIYSALGLFQDPQPLSASEENRGRKWKNRRMVPFSGRLITERVECGVPYGNRQAREMGGQTFVRMFVDDALMDLGFCGAGADGMCTLDAFVGSQSYARNQGEGDFEKCFEG